MTLETVFWTLGAFAFLLGAVVGSFLNVVIYRVPAGKSVVSPPSHCPNCGTNIRWYDNIPIVSWALLLRGRCRSCKTPIPARYALVEALTGALTLGLWIKVASPHFASMDAFAQLTAATIAVPFAFYFFFICLLVVITFVDLDHYLIPHEFTLPGMAVGVIAAFALNSDALMPPGSLAGFWPPVTPSMSIIGLLAGGLTVVVIFVAYYLVRGTEGIGGGDVTLMAVMGAWLGWPSLVFIFFAASLQGIIAAALGYLFGGQFLKHSSEILGEDANPPAAREARDGELETAATDVAPDEISAATSGDTHSATSGDTPDPEDDDEALAGGLAVPFGPFIALAGLEYFFFGAMMPMELSMSYLYGLW